MLGFGAIGQFALGQLNSNVAIQLVADAGSFTLSGHDVGGVKNRRLVAGHLVAAQGRKHVLFATLGGVALGQGQGIATPSTTTFTLRGESVGLYFGYGIAAGAASFTLTGFDVTLRATRMVAAGVGAFTLTGVDVALIALRRLAVGVGEFVISVDVELKYKKRRISVFSRAATAIFGRSSSAPSVSGRSISGQGIKGRSTGGLE